MNLSRTVVLVACLVGSISACGSSGSLSADDPVFAGIDPRIAAEVIESPTVAERTLGDEDAMLMSRMQSIAMNFELCRQVYTAYEEWITTGEQPNLPAATRPTNPIPASMVQYEIDRDSYVADIDSGDIELLRQHLLNESGCGVWIPRDAGQVGGPTIADAVRGS